MNRRDLFVAPLLAVPASASETTRKIVVVGGHPDDPETGCGGTIARLVRSGCEVSVLYLTRGEAGIRGKSHDEAARIRTAEAEKACEILGARPLFFGQIDGAAEVANNHYEAFREMLLAEEPDVVFTHWPVDTHRDHRAASLLTIDARDRAQRKFDLYFYEVMSGAQTQNFAPTDFVDITATEKLKRRSCFAHRSQGPDRFWPVHDQMNRFRGMEAGVGFAEAFVRAAGASGGAIERSWG